MYFIILTCHSNEVEVEEQVVEWLSENNDDMKRQDGIRAAYAAFLLRVYSRLALSALPSSIPTIGRSLSMAFIYSLLPPFG